MADVTLEIINLSTGQSVSISSLTICQAQTYELDIGNYHLKATYLATGEIKESNITIVEGENPPLDLTFAAPPQIPQTGWTANFHSGAPYFELLSPSNPTYPDWATVKDHLKICLVWVTCNVNNDGSLTPIGSPGYPDMAIDLDGLMTYVNEITNAGFYVDLDMWINNIETMTEAGFRAFISNFSSRLGNIQIIFNPCREYNQLGDWWGQTITGGRTTWRIVPADYNRVMTMMRKVIDELGIGNILLGSHANIYGAADLAEQGAGLYSGWLEGMRQAHVVGGSSYNDSVNDAWIQAKYLYDQIGQIKPFIFFEYAQNWVNLPTILSPEYVNASYAKLTSNSFVKGIVWFPSDKYTSEAMAAIGVNAAIYEGYTPTPTAPYTFTVNSIPITGVPITVQEVN